MPSVNFLSDIQAITSVRVLVGTSTGGYKGELRSQSNYPVVLMPYDNAGTALTSQEFFYKTDSTRWQTESNFRVDGTLSIGSTSTFDNNVTVNATAIIQSAADPYVKVNATSGGSSVYIDTTTSNWGQVMFRTGTSNRWSLWKNSTPESGSNAGSNLLLTRYDDTGASLGEAFTIWRATGKITLASVGSLAGLEFGSNGPRIMTATSHPEGVITAPIGSEVINTTDGTKYDKMSDTAGNTGWAPRVSGAGYVEDTQVMMMMGVL